jgi:hypothetical protein
MLDFLRELKNENFDIIHFISGDEKDTLDVRTNLYKDSAESIETTSLGNKYHIILFRENDKGIVINPDKFEAILLDPLEYISELIPQRWYGIIARKTKSSGKFIDNLFDNMMEV